MMASPLEGSSPGSSGAVRTASVGSLVLVDAGENSAERSVEPMPPSVSQTGEASQEVQVRRSSVINSSRELYEHCRIHISRHTAHHIASDQALMPQDCKHKGADWKHSPSAFTPCQSSIPLRPGACCEGYAGPVPPMCMPYGPRLWVPNPRLYDHMSPAAYMILGP